MPPAPATIGRYAVQRVLGRGGMGTVYLAVDPLIEREVAIKVLPAAGADAYEERLLAEARVSGRLIHPNIVGVFDIGDEQGQPFVVMPYIDGRTLASVLTDSVRPAMAVKLQWMIQLCDALAYAHERRVIHRDIKPTNLLIDGQQNLRVLDFGIAKVLTTSQIQFTSVGTPAYMAPEQVLSDPVDPRTDVFSAGLVFYELITHRRALTGTTPAQIYGQLMAGPPPRVRDAAPGTDPALAAVCERAMARDPNDRFQTARAFGEAIDAARAGSLAVTAPTVVGVPTRIVAPEAPKAPSVVPAAAPAADSTIPVGRPDHDAILEAEALAAAPEWGAEPDAQPADEPEPVERDERVAPRPIALIIGAGIVGVLATGAVLTLGMANEATQSNPPASTAASEGPAWARFYPETPALLVRTAPAWLRGIQGTGCLQSYKARPDVDFEHHTAFYMAPRFCAPDGTMSQFALFRETLSGTNKLWDEDIFERGGGPGTGYFRSVDHGWLVVSRESRWTWVRAEDGQVDLVVDPPPGFMRRLSGDGETAVYAGDAGLGIFEKSTRRTTPVPYTVDGRPIGGSPLAWDFSQDGRHVLVSRFASRDGEPDAPIPLIRFDRSTGTVTTISRDVGRLPNSVLLPAAIGSDGDWVVYASTSPEPAAGLSAVPADALYLYAVDLATGRRTLVDSIERPTTEDGGAFGELEVIGRNLVVYSRLKGRSFSEWEYVWKALPEGLPNVKAHSKSVAMTTQKWPSVYDSGCVVWVDDTYWCIDP